nr:unnamed protein product [Callosobruchus analis]
MDCLLAYYTEMFTKIEGNIFEVFSKFYNLDLSPVDSWLESHFINKVEKDDKVSIQYRKEGNKYYACKDLVKSLEYYTKSICNATLNGREYSLALANRSAVTFEMREYENCLKDIELCLKADYPTALKPKIYFRKAECFLAMSQKENFEKGILEITDLLCNALIDDKDKYVEKLNHLRKVKIKSKVLDVQKENFIELPTFSDGENENFAFASSKVKISYEKIKGRHVVARKNIQKGEVLFIEKAFIFAPVFKDNREFHPFNCKTCTLCTFCNETCFISSWNECHKWECDGMQASIWYDLGIAFPAFKAMLKGVRSGFKTIKADHGEDVKKFGDKDDNYPYFNRLVSHIYKTKNAAPYVIMAAVVVSYLKSYTNFFTWFLQQKNCPKTNMMDLVTYVGGVIAKHIAQLSSNSSIIGGEVVYLIMSKESSTLKTISERLCIKDLTTIKKAEEFLRTLQTKGSSLKVLNDSAKAALCLHLAASFLGNGFNKDAAINVSGLKKSLYQNNLHTIEKILGLDKQLTVSSLSIQLGCTEIKELAEEILDKYRAYDTKIKDLDHPQYVSAATYIACKQKSIKVHKDHFIAASRLKPRQWKELALEFEKFAKSLGLGSPRKHNKKLIDSVDDMTNEIEKVTLKKKTENEIEDYDLWRKRILEEAYTALGMEIPESK